MSQPSAGSFKVYRIDSNVFAYPCYAVCTVYRTSGGDLEAESFVLIRNSDQKGSAIACRLSFPKGDYELPIRIDVAFAEDEALRQAELDFSICMHNRNSASENPQYWPRGEFISIPQQSLVHLWISTPLKTHLDNLGNITSCEALQKYIEALRPLPTISSIRLDL